MFENLAEVVSLPYKFNYGTVDKYLDHAEILSEIYRLRYQVYVNEWGFEEPEDYPEGLEYDNYDDYSSHIYARSSRGTKVRVAGTVRLILNSPLGFPVENFFDITETRPDIDRNCIGEISRLAVSKKFRRRTIDPAIFGAELLAINHVPRYVDAGRDTRRHCEHEIVRGLYIALYRDSKLRGLTHWYAVMARGLYIVLKRWGVVFEQIGPARDYHGVRAPYLINIETMEHTLAKLNPDFLRDLQGSLVDFDQCAGAQ